MELRQNLECKVQFDKPYFFSGECIQGFIILQTERTALIGRLFISIDSIQKWEIFGQLPLVNTSRICNIELDLGKTLPLSDIEGNYLLKRGVTKIPFKLKILNELDPCFEYPLKDKYGFLRYNFTITIYSISFKQTYFNCNLRLFSRPNIDNKKKCLNKSVSKTLKKWGIFNIGTTNLTVSIPDNNFKYDDTNFKIAIFIDNIHGKETIREVRLKLTRLIEFIGSDNNIAYNEQTEVSSKNVQIDVLNNSKKYLEVILPLREEDTGRYIFNGNNPAPYDLIMSDINFYMPTVFSRTFTCKYELSVSLNFNCKVSENDLPKITYPIYIVHQSPLERQMEILQEKLEQSSKNIMFSNNIINNNILIGNKQENINNKNIINNNHEGDAPAPFISLNNLQNKHINEINNIFINNINNNNKNESENKMFTNNKESCNFNGSNNINYNVNININNNIDNSVNKNINNNSKNSGNSNKNSVDEENKNEIVIEDFENEINLRDSNNFNLL